MASVFKRSTKPGAPYYCSFYATTANGVRKRRIISTGTPEHKVARQIAAKYESESAVREHGIVDANQEILKQARKTTIESQLPAFEAKIRRKGSKQSKNAKQQLKYVRDYAAHAKCSMIAEINADTCNAFKVHLLGLGRSTRTVQANVNALKHFTGWLFKTSKLTTDPLIGVVSPNPNDDRKKERRMLLPDEWPWLVRGAYKLGEKRGMTAEARVLLYRTAIQTGLRSAELRSLNRGHFHLDGSSPFVKVSSNATKNGQFAHQYVDTGLASDLARHLQNKMPKSPAFDLPSSSRVVDMIRDDLQAARNCWIADTNDPQERSQREESDFLAVKNEAGEEFDFHCLRHTCGAWLARRGAQPKVIQSVMRHSTITLTMDTYGHLIKGAESAAVALSADLTAIPMLATGTDGAQTCFPIASNEGAFAVRAIAAACEEREEYAIDGRMKKPHDSEEKCGLVRVVATTCKAEGTGLEPATDCSATDFESASFSVIQRENGANSEVASLLLPASLVERLAELGPDEIEAVEKFCRQFR